MSSRRGLLVLTGVGLALILAGLLMLPQLRKQQQQTAVSSGEFVLPPARDYYHLAQDNVLGRPEAPLTVVEFSDVQCPHCQRWFHTVEEAFIKEFVVPGTIRFVYRSMGDFLGPESLLAAEAMYCAGEQNAFWPYHDMLFSNPPQQANSGAYREPRLVAMAQTLVQAGRASMNVDAFQQCLKEHRYRERAQQDQVEGLRLGVRGTPSFLFQTPDNRFFLLEGEQPLAAFRQAVQQLLASPTATP